MGFDLKKMVSGAAAGVAGAATGGLGGLLGGGGKENSSVLDSMKSLGGSEGTGNEWTHGPIVQGFGNGAGNGGKGGGGTGGKGGAGGKGGRAMAPSMPSTMMA
jgi:hypothetical protein